eukprot:XP_024997916.1 uncharacterized protein NAA38 isoform X1 [Gallus gallus]
MGHTGMLTSLLVSPLSFYTFPGCPLPRQRRRKAAPLTTTPPESSTVNDNAAGKRRRLYGNAAGSAPPDWLIRGPPPTPHTHPPGGAAGHAGKRGPSAAARGLPESGAVPWRSRRCVPGQRAACAGPGHGAWAPHRVHRGGARRRRRPVLLTAPHGMDPRVLCTPCVP